MEHHHSAREAMMGVVGTLFSVLLGFMIASAMERYDNAQMHGEQDANDVGSIFWISQGFSDVDRQLLRELCSSYVQDVVVNEWPKMERGEKIDHGSSAYQELWRAAVVIVAEDNRQGNLQAGVIATALALNIWLLAAYSSPFSGELRLPPTMFELPQESVFSVSSNASLLYHARVFLEHAIVIA